MECVPSSRVGDDVRCAERAHRPDRLSPAFAQIAAAASVEVLAHNAVPKTSASEPSGFSSQSSWLRPETCEQT